MCGRLAQSFEGDAVDLAGKAMDMRVITDGCAGVETDIERFAADGKDDGNRTFDTDMSHRGAI
ncbi:MAG: hypothetical protein RL743_1011, partial [Actinomycetota bacterium]